jgi:hypothetical protein
MEVVLVCTAHIASMNFHECLECYNVAKEEHNEEYLRNMKVPKTKGECTIEVPNLEYVAYTQPIKKRKVNIKTKENPKFT